MRIRIGIRIGIISHIVVIALVTAAETGSVSGWHGGYFEMETVFGQLIGPAAAAGVTIVVIAHGWQARNDKQPAEVSTSNTRQKILPKEPNRKIRGNRDAFSAASNRKLSGKPTAGCGKRFSPLGFRYFLENQRSKHTHTLKPGWGTRQNGEKRVESGEWRRLH